MQSPDGTSSVVVEQAVTMTTGHVYYGSVLGLKEGGLTSTSGQLDVCVPVPETDFKDINNSAIPNVNQWTHLSGIATHMSTATVGTFRVYTFTTVALRVDNFFLIDLTATFGAGNEPTAAQMDAILANFPNSWFNGQNVIQVPTS